MFHQFLENEKIPLSFIYGGRSSRQLLQTWDIEHKWADVADRKLCLTTYQDPESGLVLEEERCIYNDFPAVEWVLRYKNTGQADTPVLEDVQALDMDLDIKPADGEVVLRRILGCTGCCETACVSDFAPVDEVLPLGVKRSISPSGGRSSTSVMPFFNIEIPGNHGIIMAIGWSGQWAAEFERPYFNHGIILSIRAGMEHTHLKLHPGEQIRTPRILLLFWEGDWIAGQNLFRRFVLRHKTPQAGGKPVQLPIAGLTWFQCGMGDQYTEENQLEYARLYKELGLDIETYWIDAGWFEGGWPKGVGNWFPKKDAFPDGFKNLSKRVHEYGMKFLVWFEPERVWPGTWLHREHPEWLLSHAEGGWNFMNIDGVDQYLLDMGNPDARMWLTSHISRFIGENGIDIYRHDANIDPLEYWQKADAPDRQGITEIRYIEGLYDYWEALKADHPGLLVECCCSGNRRFDLESINRTINLWRSDYAFRPTADQCQTFGISRFIQLSAAPSRNSDKYAFRSVLGPGMCLCWDLHAPDFSVEQAQRDIALFKRLRPYISGDYYPLTPYSVKDNVWLAYQFDRPDLGEGVILAFRRPDCPSGKLVVRMGGVQKNAAYQMEDVDSGQKTIHKGAKLTANGLQIKAKSKPEGIVLIYRKI